MANGNSAPEESPSKRHVVAEVLGILRFLLAVGGMLVTWALSAYASRWMLPAAFTFGALYALSAVASSFVTGIGYNEYELKPPQSRAAFVLIVVCWSLLFLSLCGAVAATLPIREAM